jgi:hypothetical protein
MPTRNVSEVQVSKNMPPARKSKLLAVESRLAPAGALTPGMNAWARRAFLVVSFALFSTRRLAEILRITWAGLDAAGSRELVRSMKDPSHTIGDAVWCEATEALATIQAMPHDDKRIFPNSGDAVGMNFTRTCQTLSIILNHSTISGRLGEPFDSSTLAAFRVLIGDDVGCELVRR